MRVAETALARGNAVLGMNAFAHDATAKAATVMAGRMLLPSVAENLKRISAAQYKHEGAVSM
jgi:hypothetical protein